MGLIHSTEEAGGIWSCSKIQRRKKRSSKPQRSLTISDTRRPQPPPPPVLEEVEWKEDLDSWREKRRRLSLMRSPQLRAQQEQTEEEVHRREEEVKDRVRQLKARRSMSLCTREQYLNSSRDNILRFPPTQSPSPSNCDADEASPTVESVSNFQDNIQKESRLPETIEEDEVCEQVQIPHDKPSCVRTENEGRAELADPVLNTEITLMSELHVRDLRKHEPTELRPKDGIQNGPTIKGGRYVNLQIQPPDELKEANLKSALRAESSFDTASFVVDPVKPDGISGCDSDMKD